MRHEIGSPSPSYRVARRARSSWARIASVAALALLPPTGALAAQPAADSAAAARFARVAAAAQAAFARDGGRLWGARLDTIAWLGVHRGRAYATADPRQAGFAHDGLLWSGALPAAVNPANTSLDWGGRRWAMVLLPLPADSAAAVRLLLHEASHAAQPAVLPTPRYMEGGAGAELLDRPDGRVWLQLEWRALARAVETALGHDVDTAAAARDAADALLFRARRYLDADAGERTRQRALDLVEGLPEYTAWRLGTGREAAPRFAATILRDAPAIASFERGFPYFTGPAYAFLLDWRAGDAWRSRLAATPDLQRLLLATLPDAPRAIGVALEGDPPAPAAAAELRRLADDAARRYGGDSLRAAEQHRWTTREGERADRRRRFVEGPTLRIRQPGGLRVTFDQNGQVSLGAAGSVMANLVWKGPDGAELRAPAGALVAADWQELRVPLGDARLEPGPLTTRTQLRGDGWTAVLPAGWTVRTDGASRVVEPPK